MKRKRIVVVTGSRSDFGPLLPLLTEMKSSKKLDLKVVATGSHLSAYHGKTKYLIRDAGIRIDREIPTIGKGDKRVDTLKCVSKGLVPFFDYFSKTKPDSVLVLGDRFDIFAPAFAAYISRIPVVHLYGGEVTEGAYDEAIRHSLTKISSLHFVANELYRKRVIQMGEDPSRVKVSGSLGLDNIRKLGVLTKAEISHKYGLRWGKKNILVTYHPTTQRPGQAKKEFGELLKALEDLNDTYFIFTAPNADSESSKILRMIRAFVARKKNRASFFHSLGSQFYISLCSHVDLVLGNSSSGLIEVPALKTPTINVGDRQKGRERGDSVIDVPTQARKIRTACKRILNGKRAQFRFTNPYDKGNASRLIVRTLEQTSFEAIRDKKFHDLGGKR